MRKFLFHSALATIMLTGAVSAQADDTYTTVFKQDFTGTSTAITDYGFTAGTTQGTVTQAVDTEAGRLKSTYGEAVKGETRSSDCYATFNAVSSGKMKATFTFATNISNSDDTYASVYLADAEGTKAFEIMYSGRHGYMYLNTKSTTEGEFFALTGDTHNRGCDITVSVTLDIDNQKITDLSISSTDSKGTTITGDLKNFSTDAFANKVSSISRIGFYTYGIRYDFVNSLDDISVEATAASSSVDITFGNNYGYLSYCNAEQALDFSNVDGLTAYIITSADGTTATTEKVTSAVPAGTGLILEGKKGTTYSVPVAVSADAISNNLLKGVTSTYTCEEGDYVFGAKSGTPGFYYASNSKTVKAGKAYIPAASVTASAKSNFITLNFDGTTKISSVSVSATNSESYNLAGQRVNNSYNGIVIKNGKKIIK